MIYTLTLNTAIDMNIITKGLFPNKVNRTEHVEYSPNGKGVNVSMLLKHNNMPSKIIGIFGGFTGRFIVDELEKQNHEVIPVWVNEPTRINVFAHDGSDEFKLVSPGAFVSEEKQEEILNIIKMISDMKYLVVSGSLPPGIYHSFYDRLCQICKRKDVEIILDISSPYLKELMKYEPLLIKPNDDELKEVFGLTVSLSDKSQIVASMNYLHNLGAKNVLLTLGEKGLYFSSGCGVYYCEAPEINLISSACAGDACLGSFLSAWLNGKSIEAALRLGSATGANVAESNGLGDFKKVNEYITQINVTKIRGDL